MEEASEIHFIYPQRTLVGRIKSNGLWKGFVLLMAPLYQFVWEYVFNFYEKILYLLSPYKGDVHTSLKQDSVEIIKNDPDLTRFAVFIRSQASEAILAPRRQELFSRNDQEGYSLNIEKDFSEETRWEMLRFALSDKILKSILPYFKVVPRLNSIHLLYNVAKPSLGEVGSKMWHQDDGYYKSLSYFICISDVDDDAGPFHVYKHPHRHGVIPLEAVDTRISSWVNQRQSDKRMLEFCPPGSMYKLTGPSGTAALIDNGLCYHKGGFCKSKERLLMQIHFSTEIPILVPSIVKQLNLENHPQINSLFDNPVRSYVASGGEDSLIRRFAVKLKNPSFLIGRRILCYYLQGS